MIVSNTIDFSRQRGALCLNGVMSRKDALFLMTHLFLSFTNLNGWIVEQTYAQASLREQIDEIRRCRIRNSENFQEFYDVSTMICVHVQDVLQVGFSRLHKISTELHTQCVHRSTLTDDKVSNDEYVVVAPERKGSSHDHCHKPFANFPVDAYGVVSGRTPLCANYLKHLPMSLWKCSRSLLESVCKKTFDLTAAMYHLDQCLCTLYPAIQHNAHMIEMKSILTKSVRKTKMIASAMTSVETNITQGVWSAELFLPRRAPKCYRNSLETCCICYRSRTKIRFTRHKWVCLCKNTVIDNMKICKTCVHRIRNTSKCPYCRSKI